MRMFSTSESSDQQEEKQEAEKKGKFFAFLKKAEDVDEKVK